MHEIGAYDTGCSRLSFYRVDQNWLTKHPRFFYELRNNLQGMSSGVKQQLAVGFLPGDAEVEHSLALEIVWELAWAAVDYVCDFIVEDELHVLCGIGVPDEQPVLDLYAANYQVSEERKVHHPFLFFGEFFSKI